MTSSACAVACANIALVKYWGKRDSALNLPAAGSLSLTLDALRTRTRVTFDATLAQDELILDGESSSAARLSPWLDLVRDRAGINTRARVVSKNDFPTASGLASSASAYAALAVAASRAAGLELDEQRLSELARRGSGSAARSIFGGFAIMEAGTATDGSDAVARPLLAPAGFAPVMVIAVVGGGSPKSVSSRDAMEHCAATSPLYRAWLDTVPGDLREAQSAVERGDLASLGPIVVHSAMAMHAAALASRPPIRYWKPATLACLDALEALEGLPAYPTMDAGPHVKVLTFREHAPTVAQALQAVPGVGRVLLSDIGPGAAICTDPREEP